MNIFKKTHIQLYRHLRHGIPRKGEKHYTFNAYGLPYFRDLDILCPMPQVKPPKPDVSNPIATLK